MWRGWPETPVLVTGAAGFVGAHLARRLHAAGAAVHAVTRPASSLWRLEEILDGIAVHRLGLEDAEALTELCATLRPRVIYHCAAYGGYAGQDDPQATVHTNLIGTLNVLRAAEAAEVECVVHTGSSSEYGVKAAPMREDDRVEPVTLYGITKAAATHACAAAARATGRRIVTARLFSPYGPYEAPGRLIPSVIRACLQGQAPEVGSGEQVRDFLYIDDAVDCCLRLPGAELAPGAIVNVGSGRQARVRDVVERIVALSGASVSVRWGAVRHRQPESPTWVADLSQTIASVGWRPTTALDEGLVATIAWMQERMHAVH